MCCFILLEWLLSFKSIELFVLAYACSTLTYFAENRVFYDRRSRCLFLFLFFNIVIHLETKCKLSKLIK